CFFWLVPALLHKIADLAHAHRVSGLKNNGEDSLLAVDRDRLDIRILAEFALHKFAAGGTIHTAKTLLDPQVLRMGACRQKEKENNPHEFQSTQRFEVSATPFVVF